MIDIPDEQTKAPMDMAKKKKVSRTELIRQAIVDLLASRTAASRAAAFGLWGAGEDGLAYEERIRSEW